MSEMCFFWGAINGDLISELTGPSKETNIPLPFFHNLSVSKKLYIYVYVYIFIFDIFTKCHPGHLPTLTISCSSWTWTENAAAQKLVSHASLFFSIQNNHNQATNNNSWNEMFLSNQFTVFLCYDTSECNTIFMFT